MFLSISRKALQRAKLRRLTAPTRKAASAYSVTIQGLQCVNENSSYSRIGKPMSHVQPGAYKQCSHEPSALAMELQQWSCVKSLYTGKPRLCTAVILQQLVASVTVIAPPSLSPRSGSACANNIGFEFRGNERSMSFSESTLARGQSFPHRQACCA